MTQLPNHLIATFLDLCNPFSNSVPTIVSGEDWNYLFELSQRHGVTPFLYYRTKSLGVSLPEKLNKKWLGHYLHQIAEEKKARRQINELMEILDPERIPFILLKGASAMLRLYPQPGLRTFVDLDIIIPPDRVTQFKQAMMNSGYKPLAARNSPEDEELQKFDGHLDPLWKEECLMIESHLSILGERGEPLVGLPEIWQEEEETNSNGIRVRHLSRDQFIVHTMFHFSRHLSDKGFAEIKWFIDLLYSVKTWRIDWLKVRDIAQKWGVEKDVLPITATLNHYWQTNIPLTEKVIPFDLQTLMRGIKDQEKEYYAKLPKSYMKRLSKVRGLPKTTSQVRYLFHLLFPTRQNLRWRYNLYGKTLIMPYYLLHLFITFKKIFLGFWYKLLYHPQ